MVYRGSESISGEVTISPRQNRSGIDHIGIKVELIGQIESFFEAAATGTPPFQFFALVKELEPPGVLDRVQTFPFFFEECEKQYESYNGSHVRLRYFLKVTISRQIAATVDKTLDVWVVLPPTPAQLQKLLQTPPQPLQTEVGIQGCIHIEVEWSKDTYHLKEIVFGKINFVLVKVRIRYMEITLTRKEQLGNGETATTDQKTIFKYEVMDGSPAKGESIPIRLFLSNHDLTPTYKNVNNQFSVRYFLNTVLVDEAERRYFKAQEVVLYRKT